MGSELSVFNFNGADVRVVKDKSGAPWFVAKDVAEILGYTDTQAMTRRLDKDEISSCTDKSSGQRRHITIVNESGLYNAILGSNKPEAKSFKRWVTHEVLPEIRKTGAYVAAGETESDEEIMARALLAAQRTIERNKARIEEQAREIEELKPKAAFVDSFIVSHGNILVRDFSKLVKDALGLKKFGQKDMFEFLRNNNYMTANRYPTQYAINLKVLHVTEGLHTRNDGTTECHHCTRITPKGQEYFFNKLKNMFYGKNGEHNND